jgi:hypothetical protein
MEVLEITRVTMHQFAYFIQPFFTNIDLRAIPPYDSVRRNRPQRCNSIRVSSHRK